jgi:lipopolysaccharide export system protein LptA
MRYFQLVCLIVAVALALRAQTTSTPLLVETNAAPVARTNVPIEIRPTEINSRAAQFYMKSNVFVYIGDVHVDNPQMQLWCEHLTLEAPKMEQGEKFNRGTAETNVVIDFVSGTAPNLTTNHATSEKAVYTSIITNILPFPAQQWQTSSIVVLTGNPVVTNSQGITRMDPLVYDRIADVISSTNFKGMDINPQQTNNNSTFFETPAAKPGKTGARPK